MRGIWRLYLPFSSERAWGCYQLMCALLESCYWVMIISWDSQILCSVCPVLIDAFLFLESSALAFWHPDRLGFPKEWTLLLDWLLCFPGSFSVRRRKHWSTVPVVDKCGFCWMLFNGGQLPCRTCYSFSWLTKVDEIQLGIFWKCWTWILRKQLAIYSIKHTYQVD